MNVRFRRRSLPPVRQQIQFVASFSTGSMNGAKDPDSNLRERRAMRGKAILLNEMECDRYLRSDGLIGY